MRFVTITGRALLAALLLSVTVSAGSISVYVGYADNLRASGFFPTPWLGNPGVVSQTPSGQGLDTGAIRIDNSTGAAITVSDFTAAFNAGTQVFTLWNQLVIPNGGSGIFTQTASYNFDTSDFGYFGGGPVNIDPTHPLGGCTNPQGSGQIVGCNSYQPVISFSLDSGATKNSYTDTGHILDTFGYDFVNGSSDGNESINWNLIGSTPIRGGDNGATPEPGSLGLLASGLGAMLVALRYRRRQTR